MSRIVEALQSARRRVNPEGLVVSTTFSYVSPAVMIPLEAGLTFAIHMIGNEIDPNFLKFSTISLLGLANAVSVAAETKALKSHEYSASPSASILNVLTGRPLLASLGGHLINYAQLSVLNPINIAAVVSENSRLLVESAGATSFALTLWFTAMNTLISNDKIQPVVDRMKTARQSIMKILRK